ncbi:MAG: efflux RND transporter periplasmic adaptor subunit, partial [Flavisolibacter sp.]
LNTSNTKADLAVLETSIQKTEVRAPFSGKLGLKQVSVGAYVTTQTVITTIQKTNSLRLDFDVPEKYAVQLKQGSIVNFTTDATRRNYTASVFATESGIQETTRTLTLRARVIGDQSGLIPGGYAKVKLIMNSNPNALMIPTQAIIPQARGKQVIIYRRGTANFIDVTTGVRDSANVEILSGVNKGDTIITTGLMSLKPNMKVAIQKVANLNKKNS